jgi:integrase
MAMLNPMKDIRGPKATVHCLRSSFTDWCSVTGQNIEVVERTLDHQIDDKVRAAYARSDLLDARRSLMDAWAEYVMSTRPRDG